MEMMNHASIPRCGVHPCGCHHLQKISADAPVVVHNSQRQTWNGNSGGNSQCWCHNLHQAQNWHLPRLHGRNPMKGDATLAKDDAAFIFIVLLAVNPSRCIAPDATVITAGLVAASAATTASTLKSTSWLSSSSLSSYLMHSTWHIRMTTRFPKNDWRVIVVVQNEVSSATATNLCLPRLRSTTLKAYFSFSSSTTEDRFLFRQTTKFLLSTNFP